MSAKYQQMLITQKSTETDAEHRNFAAVGILCSHSVYFEKKIMPWTKAAREALVLEKAPKGLTCSIANHESPPAQTQKLPKSRLREGIASESSTTTNASSTLFLNAGYPKNRTAKQQNMLHDTTRDKQQVQKRAVGNGEHQRSVHFPKV